MLPRLLRAVSRQLLRAPVESGARAPTVAGSFDDGRKSALPVLLLLLSSQKRDGRKYTSAIHALCRSRPSMRTPQSMGSSPPRSSISCAAAQQKNSVAVPPPPAAPSHSPSCLAIIKAAQSECCSPDSALRPCRLRSAPGCGSFRWLLRNQLLRLVGGVQVRIFRPEISNRTCQKYFPGWYLQLRGAEKQAR